MYKRAMAVFTAAALACLIPAAGLALTPYSQDFEGLVLSDPDALGNDGWLVFGNVFDPGGAYLYGYGPFAAPNGTNAFCDIVTGEGGAEQGTQQLVVYSDYNNLDHGAGDLIESNVFHEQTIAAGDVGTIWEFAFQAKLGNIGGSSTAQAFIKTLDPGSGYALTNFITADMTSIPVTWSGFSLYIRIDASLEGQILQFGFMNTATNYEPSGIFYDNVIFHLFMLLDVPDSPASGVSLRQNYPNPFNPMTRIDFSLEQPGTVAISVFDLAGRRIAVLQQGELAAGEHHVIWDGRTSDGRPAAAGQYWYVLRTANGQVSRSMVLLK
jgi:hypothetical protein